MNEKDIIDWIGNIDIAMLKDRIIEKDMKSELRRETRTHIRNRDFSRVRGWFCRYHNQLTAAGFLLLGLMLLGAGFVWLQRYSLKKGF